MVTLASRSSLDRAVEAFSATGYDIAFFTVHVEEGRPTWHPSPSTGRS